MDNNPSQEPTPPVTPPQDPQPQPSAPDPAVQPPVAEAAPSPAPVPAAEPMPNPAPAPMPTMATPAPVPAPFPAPAAPVGSSPGGNYSPRSGPSKGLIFGLIGGFVGLVILIVGGVLLSTLLFGVTKDDYQAAYDTALDLSVDYTKIGSVYVSSYSTKTEIANGVDNMKSAITTFNDDYKKLSELKAIKADSDLAASFKKLADKKPKFDTVMGATTEAYEKILPAVSSFSSANSSSSSFRTLRASFESISDLKDANNQEFVTKAIATLTKLEGLAVKVEAGRSDYTKYDSAAVNAYYDTISEFETIVRDWQSNLTKLADDGEIADQINNLGRLVTKKLNEKK